MHQAITYWTSLVLTFYITNIFFPTKERCINPPGKDKTNKMSYVPDHHISGNALTVYPLPTITAYIITFINLKTLPGERMFELQDDNKI